MTFLRNAVLAVGMMSVVACGGGDKGGDTTPAANPCGENPCGEEMNPCGEENPCGENPCGENPCGEDMNPCGGDDMGDDMNPCEE